MKVSCAPNGLNIKSTEIAKKFYIAYLRQRVYMTKFANKETLIEDKVAMANIRKHYDELEEKGFIG